MKHRVVSLLAASILGCALATDAEEALWSENRLTVAQPFPARVTAVATSWVGYHLLLQEIGGAHRLCIARIWMSAPLEYVVLDTAKGETPENPKRVAAWTYITPGIEVDRFSWSIGPWRLGRIFGEEDLLRKVSKSALEPAK